MNCRQTRSVKCFPPNLHTPFQLYRFYQQMAVESRLRLSCGQDRFVVFDRFAFRMLFVTSTYFTQHGAPRRATTSWYFQGCKMISTYCTIFGKAKHCNLYLLASLFLFSFCACYLSGHLTRNPYGCFRCPGNKINAVLFLTTKNAFQNFGVGNREIVYSEILKSIFSFSGCGPGSKFELQRRDTFILMEPERHHCA